MLSLLSKVNVTYTWNNGNLIALSVANLSLFFSWTQVPDKRIIVIEKNEIWKRQRDRIEQS